MTYSVDVGGQPRGDRDSIWYQGVLIHRSHYAKLKAAGETDPVKLAATNGKEKRSMPKGKLRSPEEINSRIKELKRRHRPLLAELERLDIQARTLDWAMGGEDTFTEPEPPEAETANAEEIAEASE